MPGHRVRLRLDRAAIFADLSAQVGDYAGVGAREGGGDDDGGLSEGFFAIVDELVGGLEASLGGLLGCFLFFLAGSLFFSRDFRRLLLKALGFLADDLRRYFGATRLWRTFSCFLTSLSSRLASFSPSSFALSSAVLRERRGFLTGVGGSD